jgi:hypothetical protein
MCDYEPGTSWKEEQGFSCEPMFYKVYDKVDKKVYKVKVINYVDRTVRVKTGWRKWEQVIFLEFSGYVDKYNRRIYYGDYIKSSKTDWRYASRVSARGGRWYDGIFAMDSYKKWEIEKTGKNMFDNYKTGKFVKERIEEEEED